MGELLTKQPLVEALCELKFSLSGKWHTDIPEIFYTQVKEEFPERTTLNPVSFQVAVGGQPIGMPEPAKELSRLQLRNKDNSVVVQIGADVLVVNYLQPYTNWENFRDLILRIGSKYVELIGDVKLERVGLRYINHISPPEGRFDIEQFLSVLVVLKRKGRTRR